MAAVTKSGIDNARWTLRLIKMRRDRHIRRGWVFQDEAGNRLKASDLEEDTFRVLEEVQEEATLQTRKPSILPSVYFIEGRILTLCDVNIYDVLISYLCSRGYHCSFSAKMNHK